MAEKSETFVVKPTLFMVLTSEVGASHIRKIYFAFNVNNEIKKLGERQSSNIPLAQKVR